MNGIRTALFSMALLMLVVSNLTVVGRVSEEKISSNSLWFLQEAAC
jgi:hypothetical protein